MSHHENPEVFARGLREIRTGRRTLLKAGAAGLAFSAAAGTVGTSRADAAVTTTKRCYVIVLDGTRPEELDLGVTPTITALRDAGRHFPRALSQPVMETIPNHVMMMTGVHPEVSGVPANTVYDADLGTTRDMDRADDIRATTVLEQLNAAGLTTGTVLSKTYLYGVFGDRATYRWEPTLTLPVTGHEVDALTMPAAIEMMQTSDPHFMFVNLGDIDRFGHADLTAGLGEFLSGGSSLPVVRRAVLASTDQQVRSFVDAVKAAGHWDDALVIVLADHSMDWSAPDKVVSLSAVFDALPGLTGNYAIADNGGADLVYWTGPSALREAGVAAMVAAALATEGVLSVHPPEELRLGGPCGDLVAYAKAGWRFSDPEVVSNPIPGNHGHPTTRPIPFFLTGGRAPGGVTSLATSTIDVAPTVGAFFGVSEPRTGWQGKPLI